MGHAYLRGAPQDDEFRLRSARSHRAASVRARPCNPTIARVRAAAGTQGLSGNRVLRDGSIVVIEERHAEAQQQLVDGSKYARIITVAELEERLCFAELRELAS